MRERAILVLSAVLALACGSASGPEPGPPSIVLVSLDTLRADHLPAYGYERPTAPVLDAFASEAVRFEEVLAQSSGTLPSHLSLITSLYPQQFRITARDGVNTTQVRTRLRLPDAVTTLTEVLRDAGYTTAAFTDGAFMSPYWGFDQGFGDFESNVYTDAARMHGLRFTLPKLRRWLDETRPRAATPLFLVVHAYDVHEPYDALEPWARTFTGRSFRELGRSLGYPPVPSRLNQQRDRLTARDVAAVRGLYDNGIRAADAAVGELLELLDRHGLYQNSIVVVLSDHGEEFLEHGAFNHGPTVYREVIRVPLLIRLPDARRAGTVVGGPVALIDVAPTLLDLAGLPIPRTFEGRSLVGLVEGRDDGAWQAERPIYFESPDLEAGASGMQRGSWVIVETKGGTELYDVSADPGEQSNLAGSRPELAERLRAELDTGARELERQGGARGWHARPPGHGLSARERARLRALGYVEEEK